MDLRFITIEKDREGFEIQRAIIGTRNRDFWALWKVLPEVHKKKMSISREIIDGKSEWVIFRRKKVHSNTYSNFKIGYTLRSTENLLPYQPRCVQHLCNALINNNAAIDGSDTGLGKTYTALAVCRELDFRPGVVCKKAGIAGWKRACKFMNIHPLFIVNWEQAKNGKFPFCMRKPDEYSSKWVFSWCIPSGVLLIFDEVHLANHDTSINYALYTASKGLTSLSMSATLADRTDRLKAFFHVLGIMDDSRFMEWLKNNGYIYNVYADRNDALSEVQDLKEVSKILYPCYGYRVSIEDEDVKRYFKKAIYLTEIITLSKRLQNRQNELFSAMIHRVNELRELGKTAEAIVANTRYRQASELFKAEVLTDMAKEYLYEGKSVCIFVNYIETLTYLARSLNSKSLIYGTQDRDGINREKVISDFQSSKNRLIIAMVEAGGTSLDLHDLDGRYPRISLICPTYNPVTLKQVMGRTHRAQGKSIPVIKLVYAAGTIEEKVAEAVNKKLDNISALNDGDLMIENFFKL